MYRIRVERRPASENFVINKNGTRVRLRIFILDASNWEQEIAFRYNFLNLS